MPKHQQRAVWSWAFYDWANSAFATTVMAGFFPLFFKQYWSAGNAVTVSTFQLGSANSLAGLIVVILAPLLGAVADQGGAKKRFLLTFACLGIVMTGGLYWVEQGQWLMALVLYVLATIGFSASISFSDSLLVEVAPESRWDRVSALGYALGYLGGGLLFAVNVTMTLKPQWFGLADAAEAVRVSFVTVAVWWALFSLPVILFVKEQPRHGGQGRVWSRGFIQLRDTFREIRRLRQVFLFLLAYWFYIDGVDTIVRMAVDYGMSLGFDANSLIVALLVTQFVGFPAAIIFGRLGERYGARTGIYIAIVVYIGVTLWATTMDSVIEFYGLAMTIGLVQGGIQSLSRSCYARIIPVDKSAEFFGFYNMLGKFAVVLGPVMMGVVGLISDSPRLALLSIVVLFLAGGWLLSRVDLDQARRNSRLL